MGDSMLTYAMHVTKNKNYQEFLMEHLKDHEEAIAYLNAAL